MKLLVPAAAQTEGVARFSGSRTRSPDLSRAHQLPVRPVSDTNVRGSTDRTVYLPKLLFM